MRKLDHKVEELRAVLAIGAIATVAAFRADVEKLPYIAPVLVVLAISWTGYVFFMAIGASGDVLGANWLADKCIAIAYGCFSAGVLVSGLFLVIAGISWYRSAPTDDRNFVYVLLGVGVGVNALQAIRKRWMGSLSRVGLRRLLRMFAIVAVLTVPFLVIMGLVFTVFVGITVARDVALAIYSAQIQLGAIFTAIAPISFIFFQKRQPTPEQLKAATWVMFFEILAGLTGITFSFLNMISERFDLPSVTAPFGPAAFAATFLFFFLLTAMGLTRRLLEWTTRNSTTTENAVR